MRMLQNALDSGKYSQSMRVILHMGTRLYSALGGQVHKLTCCIGVTALHIFEGAAAVYDEVLCPSAEVHQVQGAEEERLYHKVSVTDCVH